MRIDGTSNPAADDDGYGSDGDGADIGDGTSYEIHLNTPLLNNFYYPYMFSYAHL